MEYYDEQRAYEEARRVSRRHRRRRNSGFYVFDKVLAVIYLIALIVFSAVIVKLDILPGGLLIAFMVLLVLLSAILFVQLFYRKIKLSAKISATVLSIILLFVYITGSAYALGTVSFLDRVSNSSNSKSVQVASEPFNVLITGIDTEGTIDNEGRSDVNMLATFNPKTGRILLTSIPRDYEVRIVNADYQSDKLTHTGFYGTDTTTSSIEDLLGIDVNYYVKVNFSTVKRFINAVDGIDVYSEYEFNPVKRPSWTVKKGWNHMNGKEALAFARERKAFVTGDNQRIKNQQAVMEALIKKATSGATMIFKYNRVLKALQDYFEMNFSSSEMRALVKIALTHGKDLSIKKNTLTGHDASMATYSTGSQKVYVMSPDGESLQKAKDMIAETMAIPEEE